jgi:HAD superfamily phosphatase (TIGR01668 family)
MRLQPHIPLLSRLRPGFLKPDVILPSVHDLTAEIIDKHGIRCIVFDVDDTLTFHRGTNIDDATLSLLQRLQTTTGIQLFIASNSMRNLAHFQNQTGAAIIRSTLLSRKPRRRHFRRIVRETGFPARETAMVGDKIFTDILGGNLAGMTTIWVLSRKQKFFKHD